MSKLRSLSTSFWSDPFIEDCSVSEKLLFIYLITNEKTNMLGIYESSIKKISFETGINRAEVQKALKRFEKVGKVKYSDNFVILVNFLKHQHFNTNMKKSALEVYLNLPESLQIEGFTVDRNNPLKAFETLSNHYGTVRKIEVEIEEELEEEKRRGKKKVFTAPTIQEVIDYFKEKGYTEESAKRAWEYYEAGNWKDSQGNQVKSWKQKVIAVWFKDENKRQPILDSWANKKRI